MLLIINGKLRIPLETGPWKNFAMKCVLSHIDMLSPFEAFQKNLLSALAIGQNFKPALKKKIKLVQNAKDKDQLLRIYFNLFLYYERMGLCYGFSCQCPIEFGESNYNPELKRMTKNWILEEKLQQR